MMWPRGWSHPPSRVLEGLIDMLWNDLAFEQKDVKKRELCLKVSIDLLKQCLALHCYYFGVDVFTLVMKKNHEKKENTYFGVW